ncbi:MAG TPA: hypothetical protein VMD30_00925 [Tepidisphaeraceae bacterium]|nr:hypothetical protein [Tepidisphaeraceae bacterium]
MTRLRAWAAILCVFLWTIYGILAWCAVRTKSATFDEPSHAVLGWFMLHRADFRLGPDVPPLWEDFISLPNGPSAIHFDPADPAYVQMSPGVHQCLYTHKILYQTAGNDGIAIVRRCRAMALILGIGLGVVISWWGWRLGGPVAAVCATFLCAFDPNMLGHGALAKNDIPMTLAYAWLGFAIWSVGKRLTWASAVSLWLAVAVAPMIKFSGVAFLPVAALALGVRAILPQPWTTLSFTLNRRSSRLCAAALVMLAAGVAGYVLLWACYDFRFNAGPDGLPFDADRIYAIMREYEIASANGGTPPTAAQIQQYKPDISLRILAVARRRHWLPESWITGYYLSRFQIIHRAAYILGETYHGGKWYYFPAAFIFKEPLATLAAFAISLAAALGAMRRRLRANFESYWGLLALLIPVAIYTGAAMSADMNLGLRYLFPIFPYLFVGAGVALAATWETSRFYRGLSLLLAVCLAAESLAAFPNFIAFFNVACGGSHGGYFLLDDSNLDWGQDLPLLARWQRQHPADRLYLVYFGWCDPSAYHIRATRLEGGTRMETFPSMPTTSGVAAISATALITSNPGEFASYFRNRVPDEILGGSIYLFHFDRSTFSSVGR